MVFEILYAWAYIKYSILKYENVYNLDSIIYFSLHNCLVVRPCVVTTMIKKGQLPGLI